MDNTEITNLFGSTSTKLFVAKEYFHHHAFEILNTHAVLRNNFLDSLNSQLLVISRVKKTKKNNSEAIEAKALNKEIRILLKAIPKNDIKLEVQEEKGVFYFSSKKNAIGGFDFGIINHHKNLIALRNLCFGEIQYHNGLKKWNDFLDKNPELKDIADKYLDKNQIGIDLSYTKKEGDLPLIVGEIQFGNWALAYRDFFKVLKANVQNSIDCLVYIVPTGDLESMLSDGIVTFDKTVKILEEFAKVISVPVWVVGIDINITSR